MTAPAPTLLLTGVTGMVGAEVLLALHRRMPDARIWCLIRPGSAQDAAARLGSVLARVFPDGAPATISALAGDLEQPGLGLSASDRAHVQAEVTEIVHGAASVKFTMPLDEARRINVGGTAAILDLARSCKHLQRLDYISTAYVCGGRSGTIFEEDEETGPFHNTYEQSKHEAEALLVRAWREEGLPVTRFRPSIVVGHSKTGFTPNQNTLYWPLRIYATGRWRMIPGRPESRFDIVPVDYVAEAFAIIRARNQPSGQAFHLTAGPEAACTTGEIAALAQQAFGARPPVFFNPTLYMTVIRPLARLFLTGRSDVFKNGAAYLPYLNSDLVFDTALARAGLAGTGLLPPSVRTYFDNLFWYCRLSDFGRTPVDPDLLVSRGRG